jgi:hypothetical protein
MTETWTTAWLESARLTNDPVGALIADMQGTVRRGGSIPGFSNIDDMRGYLLSQGACQGTLDAVPRAWRRYRNWLDRHPFCLSR